MDFARPAACFCPLTSLRAASLRALKLIIKSGVNDSLIRPAVFLLAVVAFAYLNRSPLLAQHVMVLNLFAALVTFVIGTVWLVRAFPPQLRVATASFARSEWFERGPLPMFPDSGHELRR